VNKNRVPSESVKDDAASWRPLACEPPRLIAQGRELGGFAMAVGLAYRAIGAVIVATILCAASDATNIDKGLSDFSRGAFAEAFQDWQQAASAGDSRGALYVGVLYDTGLGVIQDYRQAMAWYRHAADAGNAAGAFNVAVLYDAGLGVPQDAAKAASWYARSAAAGFARAEYNLALMYEAGTGVPQNRNYAIALYKRAAGDGIAAARTRLAALGQPSISATHNAQDLATEYFQRAQQLLLSRGSEQAERAAALFRQAAERRNPLAEYDLGYCYEKGIGVPHDQEQADTWYRRAQADASDSAMRSIADAAAGNLESQSGIVNRFPTGKPTQHGAGN
jgi:TPR repeat protein